MEDIGVLIEQKANITRKITKALQELKIWFQDKIDKVKDFFRQVSKKVKESLRHVKDDDKLPKDIKYNEDIIFKKGTVGRVYKNGVQTRISDLGIDANIVIKDSKRGLSYVANNEADKAMYIKTRVVDTLKKVTAMGGLVLALAASSKIILKSKENARRKDTVKNHFNNMEKEKNPVYDVDLGDEINSNIKKAFDDDDNTSLPAYSY